MVRYPPPTTRAMLNNAIHLEVFTHTPSNRRNDHTPITFRPPIEPSSFNFRYLHPLTTPKSNSRAAIADSHAVLLPIARNTLSSLIPSLPHSIRSAYRFSQPQSGLLLNAPGGLVSYHWHFRDLPCRAFPSVTASHPHRM